MNQDPYGKRVKAWQALHKCSLLEARRAIDRNDDMTAPVERQAYDALFAERNRYRQRIEALEAVLLAIAEPIEGQPIGNPWDFYNDLRKRAAQAISIPYVHQVFPQPSTH